MVASLVHAPHNGAKRGRPRRRGRDDWQTWVRDALANVHDPVYLQGHPLAQALLRERLEGAAPRVGRALQRVLLDSIERLKPAADAMTGPHVRRGYQILALRYAEGLDVPAVLSRLAIGKSLYYVEHERALAAVASLLSERLQPPPLTPLTRPPASFVGRERELAEVRRLLAAGRLLTLTGPPGTGKTRLAMEVAADLSTAFADGVHVVPLTQVRHPELVVPTIARALGAPDAWGRSAVERLAAVAETREALLLLDNFEHVLDAAPQLLEILARCPGLKVLATSRARLGIRGEQELVVPPLAVPEPDVPLTAAGAARYPAVALFTQRVREIQADFVLSDDVAPAVVGICRRLDGLPLALELAAPRLKVLPPAALLARLEFTQPTSPLLTAGARDLPEHQQTMRGAIDWSYRLLGTQEQRLFRRLAVFVGGCTLEAAQSVWNADPVDGLGALVDNSLLQRQIGTNGEPRFAALETIREYARERLIAGGELESTQRRHADYFLQLAEEAEPHLEGQGKGQVAWIHRLETEHGNLRAALGWLVERGDTASGMQLAAAVHYFWYIRGYAGEGRVWLAHLFRLPGAEAGTALRAKVLEADGLLASLEGDFSAARARLQESLAIAREAGNGVVEGSALVHLAQLFHAQRDSAAAKVCAEQSLALGEAMQHPAVICRALYRLGCIAVAEGDYLGAQSHFRRSLTLRHEAGLVVGAGATLRLLGVIATRLGDYAGARSLLAEGLAVARDAGHMQGILSALEAWAGLAVAKGQPARAARLLGAAAAGRETMRVVQAYTGSHLDHDTAASRATLDEDGYAAAWADGQAMTLQHAIAYALREG
jgi:non-specific serine/threonine protein kinase